MILYGQELIEKIRDDFQNASKRIWIVVPFIGSWNATKRIMGTKWIENEEIDLKVLTDIRNEGFVNPVTMKQFLNRGEVKTLPGLHAKIYIIDNSVFITSANLTETAFTKRYEICEYFEIQPDHNILDVFNNWWLISKSVPSTWQPKIKVPSKDNDTGNISGLKRLWNLPDGDVKITDFKNYQDNISSYNHFKSVYKKLKIRIFPYLPIFQEIDSFFNYLFHEHPDIPSHKYYSESFREISDRERKDSIIKYSKSFKNWSQDNSEKYRLENIEIIKRKLSEQNILKLKHSDLVRITKCFHCMNSMPINRAKFLNIENNTIDEIKSNWIYLLHNRSEDIVTRMTKSKMVGFGKSAIQELISLYYPEKYPVMNSNSNSGLKFFGYNVKTY